MYYLYIQAVRDLACSSRGKYGSLLGMVLSALMSGHIVHICIMLLSFHKLI